LPSGPAVMPFNWPETGTSYSVIIPVAGEIFPIFFVSENSVDSVNHRLPSGPAVMPFQLTSTSGTLYSVIKPVSVSSSMW
jgi:hypothetical protein